MAELVDALDSGSSRGNSVDVRVILAAIKGVFMPSNFSKIALVANGAIHDLKLIKAEIVKYEYVVAVDGGLKYCERMDLKPDLIIGDFDSASFDLLGKYPQVPVRRYLTEKDESDLELAVQAVFRADVEKLTIFGGLEKRTDHALSNLHLIRRYPKKIFLETEEELVFAIDGDTRFTTKKGQRISFLPMGGPVLGVQSKGLRWELNNDEFTKNFMSLSNLCLSDTVQVNIKQGDLICCLQKSSVPFSFLATSA